MAELATLDYDRRTMDEPSGTDGDEVRTGAPYPPRDPARELEQLRPTFLAQLALVNHAVWGGWRSTAAGFRVLDAGCGSGDNTVFAASLLRDSGAELVALDASEVSLATTAARLRARGLEGVRLVRGSIDDVRALDLGTFDYVMSAGVLHHLPSAEGGLAALTGVLAPDGALGITVPGRYGRTAIDQLQALLRLLAPASMTPEQRLRRARGVLAQLRPEHWATFGQASWQAELDLNGDAALHELLLRPTDRAYSVPDLHAWVAEADLRLLRFDVPVLYEPQLYNAQVDYKHLSPVQRQAAAELLNGRLARHSFFAVRSGAAMPQPPAWNDPGGIPTWLNHDPEGRLADALANKPTLEVTYESLSFEQRLDPLPRALLRAIDGKRPLRVLLDQVAATFPDVERAEVILTWQQLHRAASAFNLLGMFPARPS
jgi:SAM-dependent methyltransferase